MLESLFVNTYLDRKFEQFIDRDQDEVFIERLTVISVDEFEQVLPCINAGILTWRELLDSRFFSDHVYLFSVHQALYNIMKERNADFIQNAFLMQKTEEIFAKQFGRLDNEPSGANSADC